MHAYTDVGPSSSAHVFAHVSRVQAKESRVPSLQLSKVWPKIVQICGGLWGGSRHPHMHKHSRDYMDINMCMARPGRTSGTRTGICVMSEAWPGHLYYYGWRHIYPACEHPCLLTLCAGSSDDRRGKEWPKIVQIYTCLLGGSSVKACV